MPPTEWTEDQCRKALRAAIRDLNLREKAVLDARTVADSAARREAECRQELATYSDLDQRITASQVESLKRGRDVDALPFDLKAAALRSRDLATDRLDRARRACDATKNELRTAEADLAQAKAAVLRNASGVAVAIARSWLGELDLLEAKAHVIRGRLAALQLPGTNTPNDLVQRAFKPLSPVQRDRDTTTAWTAFIRDLQSDAATELGLD